MERVIIAVFGLVFALWIAFEATSIAASAMDNMANTIAERSYHG